MRSFFSSGGCCEDGGAVVLPHPRGPVESLSAQLATVIDDARSVAEVAYLDMESVLGRGLGPAPGSATTTYGAVTGTSAKPK